MLPFLSDAKIIVHMHTKENVNVGVFGYGTIDDSTFDFVAVDGERNSCF